MSEVRVTKLRVYEKGAVVLRERYGETLPWVLSSYKVIPEGILLSTDDLRDLASILEKVEE